jgi:hypothetical protein
MITCASKRSKIYKVANEVARLYLKQCSSDFRKQFDAKFEIQCIDPLLQFKDRDGMFPMTNHLTLKLTFEKKGK